MSEKGVKMNLSPINYQQMSVYQNKNHQNSSVNFKAGDYGKYFKKCAHEASQEILNEIKFLKAAKDIDNLSSIRQKVNAQIVENRKQIQLLPFKERTVLENDTLNLIRTFNDIVNQKMGKNIKSDFWVYYLS